MTFRTETAAGLTPPVRWETILDVTADATGRIEFAAPSAEELPASFYRATAK